VLHKHVSATIRRIEGHLASELTTKAPRHITSTSCGACHGALTHTRLSGSLYHSIFRISCAIRQFRLPLSTTFTLHIDTTTATMLGLSGMQPRQLAAQVLNFALVLSTAFMLWKGLSVASDSPSPIVVVLSGSMEPAFERGDLLFLWNRGRDTQVGEIVVYNVKGKDIPIVHRVVRRYGGGYVKSRLMRHLRDHLA
jgi:hypothetical protein